MLSPRSLYSWCRGLVSTLWREAAKFGVVGGVAFVIDIVGMNILIETMLPDRVGTAKFLSGGIATLFAWVGNRWWTFRHRQSRPVGHEAALFFSASLVGLTINTVYLWFTHYVLGMDSRLADNINGIIGIGFGTMFRFWAYRRFVFPGEHPGDAENAMSHQIERGPLNSL